MSNCIRQYEAVQEEKGKSGIERIVIVQPDLAKAFIYPGRTYIQSLFVEITGEYITDSINTSMTPISFVDYIHRRSQHRSALMPEADKILPLVAQAGPVGMTRGQLGNAVRLERPALDDLLRALVNAGLLTLIDGREGPVYRARTGVSAWLAAS